MAEDLWLSEGQLITDDGLASPTVGNLTVRGSLSASQDLQHLPYTVIAPGWTSRVRAILAEAATRRVFVQVWGGSITEGTGSTDIRENSWAGLLRAAMCAKWGNGGTGYWALHFAQTFTGSWTARVGIAAVEWRAASAAAANFTGLRGTEIRIFFRDTSISGAFRYRVNGGSWTTVSPPVLSSDPGSVTVAGLSDGPHTLDIEWVSGTVGINGIDCRRSTGIVFQRCCVGGRAASHYGQQIVRRSTIGITNTLTAITCTAPGHFTSDDVGRFLVGDAAGIPDNTQITAVASATAATISAAATATNAALAVDVCRVSTFDVNAPTNTKGNIFIPGLTGGGTGCDLVIAAIGVNDAGYQDATLESFTQGMDQILGGAGNAHREVMVLSEHQAAFADYGQAAGVRAQGLAIALAYSGAFVDVWSQGRHSYDYWGSSGLNYFADSVHPNDNGYRFGYAPVPIALLA